MVSFLSDCLFSSILLSDVLSSFPVLVSFTVFGSWLVLVFGSVLVPVPMKVKVDTLVADVEVDVLMRLMVELIACVTGWFVAVWVVGNTVSHPAKVGVTVHWLIVGSTALQPTNVGVAIHWLSVGVGEFKLVCCVTGLPVTVP